MLIKVLKITLALLLHNGLFPSPKSKNAIIIDVSHALNGIAIVQYNSFVSHKNVPGLQTARTKVSVSGTNPFVNITLSITQNNDIHSFWNGECDL